MPTNILPSQIQSGGVNQNQVLAWDGSNWVAATTVVVGNSTVNSSINSTALAVGNSTINATAFAVGNSTVNSTINSTALAIGNSTVNATALAIGNSTVNSSINATSLAIGSNVATFGTAFYSVANGNVAIGTSTPNAPLDVKKSDSSTTIGDSLSVIKVNNNSGTINATSGVEFFHSNDTASNAYRLAGIYGVYTSYNASGLGGGLGFATNTPGDATIDERMRITSAGLVGIGTSTPSNTLSIVGTAGISGALTVNGAITTGNTDLGNNQVATVAFAIAVAYTL